MIDRAPSGLISYRWPYWSAAIIAVRSSSDATGGMCRPITSALIPFSLPVTRTVLIPPDGLNRGSGAVSFSAPGTAVADAARVRMLRGARIAAGRERRHAQGNADTGRLLTPIRAGSGHG